MSAAKSPPNVETYKFLTKSMHSPTGTGKWTEGKWRSVRGALVPCNNGLHATTASNLTPFINETLWRVEIAGEWIWDGEPGTQGRKIVARRMRLIERVEAWNDRNARLFAADCAERVLKHFEDRYPDDKRPREAIEAARRFARGEATLEELAAARDAAWDAARSAAWGAAWAAARAADGSADGSAAWDAARSAAGAAARAAAGAAARDAAWDAAWSAERECQNRHLADMLGLVYDLEGAS